MALTGSNCAKAPHGPYAYHDYSDTLRIGGDFIDMESYEPGKPNTTLQPPTLVYPPNHSVFSYYPRELFYRWKPAAGTPPNAQYLFEYDSTCCGNDEKFGDWTKASEPMFAYRTGKQTLNDRFEGAQPGRWRVKAIDATGESAWSDWSYFRFTQ
jgi:hypothetical protein